MSKKSSLIYIVFSIYTNDHDLLDKKYNFLTLFNSTRTKAVHRSEAFDSDEEKGGRERERDQKKQYKKSCLYAKKANNKCNEKGGQEALKLII